METEYLQIDRNAIAANVIGDVHGRDAWKDVIIDGVRNVFVGDYFDPYQNISFEECKNNFFEIIDYKKRNPETILLYADHELHYILYDNGGEIYSRFDSMHAIEIQDFLYANEKYFNGVAYAVGNYLITHAGVSRQWWGRYFGLYRGETPYEVAEHVNNLWEINKKAFMVRPNGIFDCGNFEGPSQSPIWLRSYIFEKAGVNLFEGTNYWQVFGHTQVPYVVDSPKGFINVDCLGNKAIGKPVQSYQIIQQNKI